MPRTRSATSFKSEFHPDNAREKAYELVKAAIENQRKHLGLSAEKL